MSEITEGLISPVSPGVRPYALDPEHAKALWAKSEEMVGERFLNRVGIANYGDGALSSSSQLSAPSP